MKVFLKDLQSAVAKAASILSPRPALVEHSVICLKTDQGRLLVAASSHSGSIEVALPCEGELAETLVNSKLFHTLLNKVWGKTVSLAPENRQLVVSGEFGEAKLATFPIETFVKISWLEPDNPIDLPSLKDCTKQILFAVADKTKPILSGVHFLFTDYQLRLTATDGYRLTIKTVPLKTTARADCVIDADVAETLFSLTPGRIIIKNNLAQFENDNTRLLTRLIDGKYPDISHILSKTNQSFCSFKRSVLLQAVNAATVFASDSKIKLEFGPKITITSENKEENRGKCKVEAEYLAITGEAPSFSCNPKFLVDWLNSVAEDVVDMEWTAHDQPVFLKQGSNLGIIMPMLDR